MKLKKIVIFFVWTFFIGITCIFSLYFYIKNNYTNVLSDEQLNELINEIEKSEDLPKDFYNLYEIQYPGSLDNSYNWVLFKALYSKKNIHSPISHAARSYFNKIDVHERLHLFKQNEISLSLKLDDKVTPKECLNWLIHNDINLYKHKTPKKFMEDFYKKSFENFSANQMAGLVIHMKNPALYNPYKRKERFDADANFLLVKYKKSLEINNTK